LEGPRNEDGKEIAEKVDGLEQGIEGLGVRLNQGSDYVKIDRLGTTSASDDKEYEEDGFDLVVEGKKDYQRVYCAFVGRYATPDDPDGHDALHVTLALGHRPDAGLTTIAWGGSGGFEDLEGVVDVEEEVGETEDWDYGAHFGLATVLSRIKVPLYACRIELSRRRGCTKVVVVGKEEKKMVDET
jgi:hypothetical protein